MVVCHAAAPGLLEVLATARDAGSHVIVVARSLPSVDPWQLLVAGAADVVPWQGDPRPVGARLARVDEVERIVDSAEVTEVILGDSAALRDALRELVTAARFGAGPILILGETGTGKELCAGDPRRERARPGPFVVVDCARPRDCSRASCSGTSAARSPAPQREAGRFEARGRRHAVPRRDRRAAARLQTKLLRVLQEGMFEQVGEDPWQRTGSVSFARRIATCKRR